MRIMWQVDDGYAGKGRPRYTEVEAEDLMDCDTEEEFDRMMEDAVQEDFQQCISWFYLDKPMFEDHRKCLK